MLNTMAYLPWKSGRKLGEEIPSPISLNDFQNISKQDLDFVLECIYKIRHNRKLHLEKLLKEPYETFIKKADILNSSGELIESYICKGLKKISPSLEMGDRVDLDGTKFQFKSTIVGSDKKIANFNRIQNWQNVDEYRFVIIDRSNDYKTHFYIVPKEQMGKELRLLRACSTNGTEKSNRFNKRKFLSIQVPVYYKNKHFIRWNKLYRRTDMEETFESICRNSS